MRMYNLQQTARDVARVARYDVIEKCNFFGNIQIIKFIELHVFVYKMCLQTSLLIVAISIREVPI